MLRHCLYSFLILWPSLLALAGRPADSTVYETLRNRFNANTLAAFDPAAQVDELIQTLDETGKWTDLNYSDRSGSRWQPGIHWDRLLLMAKAYRTPGHPLYNKPALLVKLVTAITWWNNTAATRNGSYWWKAIGVPIRMGETLLLLGDALPATQKAVGAASMKLGVKPDNYDYYGPATGQNQIWLATVHLMTGVLEKNDATLKRAFSAMYDEVKLMNAEEGLQPDYSFHQHGPQLYSGGYGLGFTRNLAEIIRLAQDTPYAFSSEKTALFQAFVADGQQWMIRGQTFDHNAVGREIARPSVSAVASLGGLRGLAELIAAIKGPRQAELQAMARRMAGNAPALTGNRHFWRSDFMTHHRSGYYTSVRMASNRAFGSESGNKENLKGYYLGQGVQLIYRTGNEYQNIFPVWDWRRLPGHLCEQSSEPLPLFDWGIAARGTTSFVGGVSDGTYGLSACDYQREKVSAKRAWFHFDDEIVCLGAGVSCPTDNPLFQSVNQCHLTGDVVVANAGKPLSKGMHTLPKTAWVWHDSVGYVFPEKSVLFVKNDVQTGAWRDINNNVFYADEILNIPVFSLWLDFGKQVRNGAYSYVIRPGVSATDMSRYKNPVVVLQNDSTLQAVRHTGLNLTQAAFYQPGKLALGDELVITVDKPTLLLLRNRPDGLDLTLANPKNEAQTLVVTVNQKLECSTCRWSPGSRVTTVTAELPTGDLAGKSLTLNLKKS